MNDNHNIMRDNKGNQFNGENNGTVNNTQNIYNTIIQRISDKEKQKQKKLTNRPCLKDKLGQKLTCFGYIVGRHRYLQHLYTIVNIVDITGEFVSDHIQLDFKEDEYDYSYDRHIGCYIRFTGEVVSYMRDNNTIDYTINISKKVLILSEDYDIITDRYNCEDHELHEKEIDKYLSVCNITKMYDIIDKLRKEINELTNGLYFEDYLYYYIINQYTLNTSTYDIYQGNLRDQKFKDDCVIGIMVLLGSLLFELKSGDSNLGELMFNICTECNVLQGIENYTSYKDNPKLYTFYKMNLSKHDNEIGKKKLNEAFQFVVNRSYNFNSKIPYDKNKIDVQVIKRRAYHMIQNYIIIPN